MVAAGHGVTRGHVPVGFRPAFQGIGRGDPDGLRDTLEDAVGGRPPGKHLRLRFRDRQGVRLSIRRRVQHCLQEGDGSVAQDLQPPQGFAGRTRRGTCETRWFDAGKAVHPRPRMSGWPRRTLSPSPNRRHGHAQASGAVESGGKRVINANDTLFHRDWWRIA